MFGKPVRDGGAWVCILGKLNSKFTASWWLKEFIVICFQKFRFSSVVTSRSSLS